MVLGTAAADSDDDTAVDNGLANIDGSGVGITDWILVQVRIVPAGSSVEDVAGGPAASDDFPEGTVVATKAALLLSDGSVSDADAESLLDGIVAFEDIDFDPATQKIHVAISHRNHLAVMGNEAAEADDEDVYEYAFDERSKFYRGEFAALEATPPTAPAGVWSVPTGDSDRNGAVGPSDGLQVREGAGTGSLGKAAYRNSNLGLRGTSAIGDELLVRQNSGLATQIAF